ncbi:hypothetical protein [Rhodobacter calidifons]|uniref:Uncharacterized protein n=1 Tax=Rhodobacter calidifons TaxID=2715277 RepID=A0ABX0G8T8_9RHOB|nr:hypothetical protein [Rhodobacter calidifons]NHB77680.1 hypothetical protein [Rhodobacter calidifons]
MALDPSRKRQGKGRPEIWASGGQRPPFDLRALGRAGLHLSREAVASLHARAARGLRRAAVNVKNGAGRIPAGRLGRAERFVPSHLRVAAWIGNLAATLSHASASADPDIPRGNALVAELAPPLRDKAVLPPEPGPMPAHPPQGEVAPVILSEPKTDDDPLAAIRGDLSGRPGAPRHATGAAPESPLAPPGAVAEAVIQVGGYLVGWGTVILTLPFALIGALWLWIGGRDLKTIGRED